MEIRDLSIKQLIHLCVNAKTEKIALEAVKALIDHEDVTPANLEYIRSNGLTLDVALIAKEAIDSLFKTESWEFTKSLCD